jgi:hypothetical protein
MICSCAVQPDHALIATRVRLPLSPRTRGGKAWVQSRGCAARLGAGDIDPCGVDSIIVASRRQMLMGFGLCRIGVGQIVFARLLRAL